MTGNQLLLNPHDYTIKTVAIQGKKTVGHAKRGKTGVNKMALRGMMIP